MCCAFSHTATLYAAWYPRELSTDSRVENYIGLDSSVTPDWQSSFAVTTKAPKEASPNASSLGRLVGICAAAYLVLAIVIAVADILFVLRHYTTFPFGDQWVWLARMHERGVLRGLFAQYNEHRLPVPGVFYLLDYRWFGGRNSLLIAVSLLFQAGCAVLLILPMWRQPEVPKWLRYPADRRANRNF